MTFEQLPDEILLIICSYLTPFHVIQAFNDLNSRLNSTINQYRKNIDLRHVNICQFHFLCKMIKLSFGKHVRSITLSNAAPAVRQLVLFRKQVDPFVHILSNLECLTLLDHHDNELDLYLPLISMLTNLKELKVTFVKSKNETILCSFITQMLADNFVYLDHSTKRPRRSAPAIETLSLTGTGYLKLTPICNDTLKYLNIEIDNTDDLMTILTGCDCLQSLNIHMKQLSPLSPHTNGLIHNEEAVQHLSLTELRLQARWTLEALSFDQFAIIISMLPNLQNFYCTLYSERKQDELLKSDYNNKDQWRNLCARFHDLITLDCIIKYPLNSSHHSETDFIHIISKVSGGSDRTMDICFDYNHDNSHLLKHELCLELDIYELQHMTGTHLARKLRRIEEITLYSDSFDDDDSAFTLFPDALKFANHDKFLHLRSLDFLGEFLNTNNIFLTTFLEQLISRTPNLQSIGFFPYWAENMADLVLNFLRPLSVYLKFIKKCYLYTEGDLDEKFISELAQLLPSLTLLSVKIDWFCNTAEVVSLCLRHMKHLVHLEVVLEDIPDYLDEDFIDRIKVEKELECLAMTRDLQEWLKRNTVLGNNTSNRMYRAEKVGTDLRIWL